MNVTARQLLTHVLVTAYASVALLGHGLHWLAPEGGHHDGMTVVRCAVHGSAHHDHDHHHHHAGHHEHVAAEPCESQHDDALSVTSGGCVAHTHLCEICAFLAQIRSERPQISTAANWHHVVAAATIWQPISYSPTSLSWHSPRGPPQVG